MRPTILIALTLSAALSVTAPAAADDAPAKTLRVVNDTHTPVNQLFVFASKAGGLKTKIKGIFGTADDDRDRLESGILAGGRSITVELNGKHCRYDLRAVLEDGTTYLAEGFDACVNDRWAVASGQQR